MNKYGLNDEQWEAIQADSPCMVNASAGSGKTRCLIAKIRLLLDNGAKPDSICAITFTNKAAREMKERLRKFHPDLGGIQMSTIHSMCVRIIKAFTGATPLKAPFSIYDDADQLTVIKTVAKARKIDENPRDILAMISRAKSDDRTEDLDEPYFTLYKAYQDILVTNNACDFDDLLVYALKCVKTEECQKYFQKLWQHLLVDEFQDTSTIQYDIVMSLYKKGVTKTLFVVGDWNQSIYGWRGAKPENINDLEKTHGATVKNLTYNYRSGAQVISFANKFLQYGKPMVAKSEVKAMISMTRFNSLEDEAAKVAEAIQKMGGYEETAVLYRVNSRSLMFERAFAARRIPYKVVGDIPFYRRKVVKDLLAYCKAAVNENDMESLVRVVNVPKRGFGEAKQERLLKEGREYLQTMAGEMSKINSFVELLGDIKTMAPVEALDTVIGRTGYRSLLDKESSLSMLDTLMNVSAEFKSIDELILASTFLEEDSGKGVRLMTAHASKGLEFDRVFVVGVEEGVWPHSMSMNVAEENRLYYVACTRAKKFLNVSFCRSKLMRGKPIEMRPSPLIIESQQALSGN